MAKLAAFSLQADQFPLGTIFTTLPNATVQLERVVPEANGVVPYFWVRGVKTDSILTAFSSHPGVQEIQVVDQTDSEYLMRCSWVPEYDSVLDGLIDPELVLLSAVGTAEQWTFEIRGESQELIATFHDYCRDHAIPITLISLSALEPLEAQYGLTDKQREAMILAYRRGYFDTPRGASLHEIATELGITQQALASRLRRGNRRLIEKSLIEQWE